MVVQNLLNQLNVCVEKIKNRGLANVVNDMAKIKGDYSTYDW